MPMCDQLEIGGEGTFAVAWFETGAVPNTDVVFRVFGEELRKVRCENFDGFSITSIDSDYRTADCLWWRTRSRRCQGRADFRKDFDFVDGGDRHDHCFDRFCLGRGFGGSAGLERRKYERAIMGQI